MNRQLQNTSIIQYMYIICHLQEYFSSFEASKICTLVRCTGIIKRGTNIFQLQNVVKSWLCLLKIWVFCACFYVKTSYAFQFHGRGGGGGGGVTAVFLSWTLAIPSCNNCCFSSHVFLCYVLIYAVQFQFNLVCDRSSLASMVAGMFLIAESIGFFIFGAVTDK